MFFEVTLMQLLHIVMNIVILEHLVTQTVTYCHGIWFRRESKRNAPHSYTLHLKYSTIEASASDQTYHYISRGNERTSSPQDYPDNERT
jgi:hypothetical protein